MADDWDDKIYAYDMASKARDATRGFNTLRSAGNNSPEDIWSDGITMWVADDGDSKIYAYDMASKARDVTKDFNTLRSAGNNSPEGIWSDEITMWVADDGDSKIYAYDMLSKGATPAAPAIRLVMVGTGSLTVSWTAPLSDDDFIAYDLRHILSNAPDKADANWTVMQNVWTTGSEPLSYELTGLTGGEQYNVQVRAGDQWLWKRLLVGHRYWNTGSARASRDGFQWRRQDRFRRFLPLCRCLRRHRPSL